MRHRDNGRRVLRRVEAMDTTTHTMQSRDLWAGDLSYTVPDKLRTTGRSSLARPPNRARTAIVSYWGEAWVATSWWDRQQFC